MEMTRPKLLTVDEVATQLRVGRSKAWTLVLSGAIPSVKIGQSRRVSAEAVDQYIEHLLAEAQSA